MLGSPLISQIAAESRAVNERPAAPAGWYAVKPLE